MIFTCISDTHNKHLLIPHHYLTGGDGILHTGDISSRGSRTEIEEFLSWYNELPYKYKIVIAGNHDYFFQDAPEYEIEAVLAKYPNVIYLNDSGVDIEGIKIWGSPVQPYFHGWAFNRKGDEIKKHWDLIPLDTNILLTHGPIKGYLDKTKSDFNAGCPFLLEKMNELRDLKLHQCGHIHEAYGMFQLADGPLLLNASVLNLQYNMVNPPITFNYEQ
jgi:Icc-related predicted phosphoesterase